MSESTLQRLLPLDQLKGKVIRDYFWNDGEIVMQLTTGGTCKLGREIMGDGNVGCFILVLEGGHVFALGAHSATGPANVVPLMRMDVFGFDEEEMIRKGIVRREDYEAMKVETDRRHKELRYEIWQNLNLEFAPPAPAPAVQTVLESPPMAFGQPIIPGASPAFSVDLPMSRWNCPRCGQEAEVPEDTVRVRCGDCEADMMRV